MARKSESPLAVEAKLARRLKIILQHRGHWPSRRKVVTSRGLAPEGKPIPIIGLSGGKDSAALAVHCKNEWCPEHWELTRLVFTDTGVEDPETIRFVYKVAHTLGKRLVVLQNWDLLRYVANHGGLLPSFKRRWCTNELKLRPFNSYARQLAPSVCAVGIRADEVGDRKVVGGYGRGKGVETIFPLVKAGIDKPAALALLKEAGLELPATYELRTRGGNCWMCFFQQIGEWRNLYHTRPKLYRLMARIEEECQRSSGFTLRPDHTLVELAERFQQGEMFISPFDDMIKPCRICTS